RAQARGRGGDRLPRARAAGGAAQPRSAAAARRSRRGENPGLAEGPRCRPAQAGAGGRESETQGEPVGGRANAGAAARRTRQARPRREEERRRQGRRPIRGGHVPSADALRSRHQDRKDIRFHMVIVHAGEAGIGAVHWRADAGRHDRAALRLSDPLAQLPLRDRRAGQAQGHHGGREARGPAVSGNHPRQRASSNFGFQRPTFALAFRRRNGHRGGDTESHESKFVPNRLTLAIAALAAAFAAPAHAGIGPQITNFTLSNGLEVVVIPDHRTPVVTHMLWYKVGSADETPGKSGLAHFLEHLMFKGTAKNPAGRFSQVVATIGGQENAFTAADYTGYFQRVPRDQLRTMMEFEADRMTGLVLTDEVVRPELNVVLEEQNMRVANNPAARLGEQM